MYTYSYVSVISVFVWYWGTFAEVSDMRLHANESLLVVLTCYYAA